MDLTYFERKSFTQLNETALKEIILEHEHYSILLFKTLSLPLQNKGVIREWWDESLFEDKEQFHAVFVKLLNEYAAFATEINDVFKPSIMDLNQDNDFYKTYTTGELAKYLKVSVPTISSWIKEGRFEGVEHIPNKRTRIPATSLFRTDSGVRIPVSKVLELCTKEDTF